MSRRLSEIITVSPGGKRYVFLRLGIGPFYAERGGGLVLRGDTHWTKICGIWINTPRGCVWIKFRRFNRLTIRRPA